MPMPQMLLKQYEMMQKMIMVMMITAICRKWYWR